MARTVESAVLAVGTGHRGRGRRGQRPGSAHAEDRALSVPHRAEGRAVRGERLPAAAVRERAQLAVDEGRAPVEPVDLEFADQAADALPGAERLDAAVKQR